MATFTSKADGGWDTEGASTWNEAGHPVSGDTVTIDGHAITCESATTCYDLQISSGSLDTTANNWALNIEHTLKVGNNAGAASTAQLICNSSDVDIVWEFYIYSDGEFSAPDASGSLTIKILTGSTGGIFIHNNGTVNINKAESGITGISTPCWTFYNVTLTAGYSHYFYAYQGCNIENTLQLNGYLYCSWYVPFVITMGTATSSGTIAGTGGYMRGLSSGSTTTVKAVNTAYPVLYTQTNDIDWDFQAGDNIYWLLWNISYNQNLTTGAGSNNITMTFRQTNTTTGDLIIGSGDVVIFNNTATLSFL